VIELCNQNNDLGFEKTWAKANRLEILGQDLLLPHISFLDPTAVVIRSNKNL
jgi:hypothetical protein